MQFSIEDWHKRFRMQSIWTKDIRTHLLNRTGQSSTENVLEIGCGTGAVLQDFYNKGCQHLFGLDYDFDALLFAGEIVKQGNFINGSAFLLPFRTASFDLTYCHYLLLWLKKPINALMEMARVTKPYGYVFAFAEPDYTSRIVYPQGFNKFTKLQHDSLQQQGADISIGKRLNHLFLKTGLTDITTGIIGAEFKYENRSRSSEFLIMKNDLNRINPSFDDNQLKLLMKRKDFINFVPTFYACGRVKSV